jgi:LemA protein
MTDKAMSVLRIFDNFSQSLGRTLLELVFLSVLVVAGVFAVPGCQKYDTLVEKDQVCQQKWSDLEADLQRRSELIPNLVSTVKAAANYEQSTLTKITEARASATSIKLSGDDFSDPAKMKAFEEAQAKLSSGAIGRLLVSNENYPKLQANGQFTDLMKQLEGTENRILRARQQYNESVKDYNTELGKIRGAAVNKATGQPFKPRVYFSAAPESTAAPKVSF